MTRQPPTPDDLATAQRVLATAALRDPRMPRPDDPAAAAVATALAEDLAGIDPDAAVEAIGVHYRQSADRVMPAHIWAIVRRDHPAHPAFKTTAEALASAETGPGDRLAADRDQPALTAGPEDAARERAEFRAKMREISDGWAMSKPTGFVGERDRHSPRREPTSRISAPFGADTTICHQRGCAVEIKAPPGWDPANPGSPRLHCARHLPPATATETGAA